MRAIRLFIFLFPLMSLGQGFQLTDSIFSVGSTCRVKILFDFDKSTIRPESFPVLDSIVSFLENNPSLKIEVGNHKDSRGAKIYSSNLTLNRAKSVVNYLTSKKVDPRRVVAKGYGSTLPIVTDAQIKKLTSQGAIEKAHQTNRRTELKILSVNYPNICIPEPDTLQGMPVLQSAFKEAKFPGGDGALFSYILKHLVYPTEQKDLQTRVYISYVVDTIGKVKNVCIFRPFYKTELSPLDKITVKLFEDMPAWLPAEIENGRKTPFRMNIPLRIEVK